MRNNNTTNLSLKKIKTINQFTNLISIFPNGNIICADSTSLIIYNINFTFSSIIKNAHEGNIICISIKDNNNFITSSIDTLIKIWKKNSNIKNSNFYLLHIIEESHKSWIYGLIYYTNDIIISCSHDSTIKFWDLKNKYQCITIIRNLYSVSSFLLIKEYNTLISSGDEGIKSWNINNINCICHNKNIICFGRTYLEKFNNDQIIIKGNLDNKIKIIQIHSLILIKIIDFNVYCYSVCVLENKNVFLLSGNCNNINIYDSNSLECLNIIKDNNSDNFMLCKINDNFILSYSKEHATIVIWSIN